jgi:hypothetical protein
MKEPDWKFQIPCRAPNFVMVMILLEATGLDHREQGEMRSGEIILSPPFLTF